MDVNIDLSLQGIYGMVQWLTLINTSLHTKYTIISVLMSFLMSVSNLKIVYIHVCSYHMYICAEKGGDGVSAYIPLHCD